MEAEQADFCVRHPSIETGLRCGRCDDLICPRCLVQTPVGARCPDCARSPAVAIPMLQLGARHYVLAFGTALGLGAALGVAWWWVLPFRLGLFFGAFLGVGMGWLMFKAVDRAVPNKRGTPIQVAIGAGPIVAYLLRNALEGGALIPSGDLTGLIVVAVAVLFGVSQVR